MATVPTFTKSGSKATTAAKLDKNVFGLTSASAQLIKSAYEAYLANGRGNFAQAKTRGLISGGGRKPWRQKGTGRARAGSIRSPIWRGGGIVFGPTGNENYSHKIHTSAKRQALRESLSIAAGAGKIIVIEDFQVKDNKTAEAAKLLTKIGASGKTLVAVANKTEELSRSVRNLQGVKLVQARYLNVFDVMNADSIVITTQAMPAIVEWLAVPAKAAKEATT